MIERKHIENEMPKLHENRLQQCIHNQISKLKMELNTDNVKIEKHPGVLLDPNAAKARIYVGGLLKKVTDDHIRERFSQYGEILDMVHNSGYAIIQFSTPAAAFEAIHNEDGKPMLTGKKMKVKLAGIKVEAPAPSPKPPIYHTSYPNAPQDIEIIVFSHDLVPYAEEVLKKVLDFGFQADIMIKKDKFSLYELLEDLKNHSIRPPLMAILIDECNIRERSVTLQYIQRYEHRIKMSLEYSLSEMRIIFKDFLEENRLSAHDIFEKEVERLAFELGIQQCYEMVRNRPYIAQEMDTETYRKMVVEHEKKYFCLVRR